MIILDRLTVSYPGKKRVIDELELSLPEHQIHGIVGLNGAGKTTLLNTIFGLKKKYTNSLRPGMKIRLMN